MADQDPNQPGEALENDNKPFRFLDLPPELRVRVYEYYFGHALITVQLNSFSDTKGYTQPLHPGRRTNSCAILRASKVIHREATKTMEENITLVIGTIFFVGHLPCYPVALRRLACSRKVFLTVDLRYNDAATNVSLVESWMMAVNGGLLARQLVIHVSYQRCARKFVDRLVGTLRSGLRCDLAKGHVSGELYCMREGKVSSHALDDMIGKLNGE